MTLDDRNLRNQFLALFGFALLAITGCSRDHYRLRADDDAYSRLREKAAGTPWSPPGDYSVYPAPHSRLHDPTCVNDPRLPEPAPQLYEYELPELPERDNARFTPHRTVESSATGELPLGGEHNDQTLEELDGGDSILETEARPIAPSPMKTVAYQPRPSTTELGLQPAQRDQVGDTDGSDKTATDVNEPDVDELPPRDPKPNIKSPIADQKLDSADDELSYGEITQPRQVPLPASYWNSIPPECLARMFEFDTVREEYAATFGHPPVQQQLDDSPRLALEDIVDLTLLNSRELQTQKELLFRVALALTLERFDYELKPSFGNNGSSTTYTTDRNGGITQDRVRIPTVFQLERMLYTGGDFIGRFANSVLLTFHGPQGFAANVSSDLLFDFSQSLLQRDVRLESLTQSERNVVYAAREFTRFRKELFVQQASDYYSLIRQFRQIEINCQNYFTLAREFNQRSIEIKFGMAARTQLDQVEQQVITGRQSILSSCTSLENSLDSLKIRMGIPTEQPLNLDLSELELLTLRDELAVNAELIERTRQRIDREFESETRSALVIFGSVGQMAEQMLDALRLREQLGDNPPDSAPLENRLIEVRIESSDIDVEEDRKDLTQELSESAPDPTKVIQRRRDVADELLKKVSWQIRLLQRIDADANRNANRVTQFQTLRDRLEDLETRFLGVIFQEEQDKQGELGNETTRNAEDQLVADAAELQEELQALTNGLDLALGRPVGADPSTFIDRAIRFAEELIATIRDDVGGGLVPLQIDMDEAMMTALVQRFDLMNERGALADDWRQIKYAADDLRSVLNLQASHNLRTRSGQNQPFDFTFDDSTTSAGISLDLPFNRRAQRNRFRTSLFGYQAALRRVMQLEDNVKLSVRRDLRSLNLDRQQYGNDVAGAALASERVTGTELEVRGGFATSRDFLESQQAYVRAISGVASDHINYIVGRLELFLDLESLTVGDNGFWDELYDENHQPAPFHQIPDYARPAYGELHPCLKYSPEIARMRCVPNGVSMVHKEQEEGEQRVDERPIDQRR
ncbi:TolC family protein [Planctomycetota bacterium]